MYNHTSTSGISNERKDTVAYLRYTDFGNYNFVIDSDNFMDDKRGNDMNLSKNFALMFWQFSPEYLTWERYFYLVNARCIIELLA